MAEPRQMLPTECVIASRKARFVSRSIPPAKCENLTREIVTSSVFLTTCMVHVRLRRSTKMKTASKLVAVAVAPPMPASRKHE